MRTDLETLASAKIRYESLLAAAPLLTRSPARDLYAQAAPPSARIRSRTSTPASA